MELAKAFKLKHGPALAELVELKREASRWPLERLLAEAGLEAVREGEAYFVPDTRLRDGFLTGGMVSAYVYCPRMAWFRWNASALEARKGLKVSPGQLKAIALGSFLHREYARRVAEGPCEVLVADLERGLAGHVDELRVLAGRPVAVELKTGLSAREPDFAVAQLRFYLYLLRRGTGADWAGLLVSLGEEGFEVEEVGLGDPREVERLIEAVRRAVLSEVPPGGTEVASRCAGCPFKGLCEGLGVGP